MSSAKLPVIDAHLHDASLPLLQMMAASEEERCSLQSCRFPSIADDDDDGGTVCALFAHYRQGPASKVKSKTTNHQFQSMTDTVSSQSHHHHPHLHHGHQQATNQVNNNNTSSSSSSSAFTLQTQMRRRRFFSTSSSYRHSSHILAFFLFFASILLAHFTSPISCLDSYNDLEDIQKTSLCDAFKGPSALGMESGTIPDSALSASSSYNEQSVGPQNARLNRELNGGAWCPASQLDSKSSGKEWIQVNFSEPYVITKIATQGRFGNGMGVEFAETFWLHYTRDGVNWMQWRNKYGEYEIQGNMDTYSIVESVLSIPLVAVTAIRLLPISQHMRTCCVRFEVFGCPYKDGPISYTMFDGVYNGRFGDLIDQSYDGFRKENGFLAGGLGQLVDGIKGDDNYKVNKGFEWIGWKSNSNYGYMTITFEFADIRNFTYASFHCNNLFTKEMQVFHSAKIWFSLDGVQWSQVPEDFEYMPDTILEKARDVMIHLHQRVGRFIKFDLRFAAKWLLISEVRFNSKAVTRGVPISELDFVKDPLGPITMTPQNSQRQMIGEPYILVICAIGGVLVIFFVLFFFLIARKRKEKLGCSGIGQYTTVPMKDVVSTPLYCEPQDGRGHLLHHPMPPLMLRSDLACQQYPGGILQDPEYAVPDIVAYNTNGPLLGNGKIHQQQQLHSYSSGGSSGGGSGSGREYPMNKEQMKRKYPHLDLEDESRYYASTDVIARSNLLSFEVPPVVDGAPASINGFSGSGHSPKPLTGSGSIASHTPPPPLALQQQQQQNSSPPSSLSSNSSRLLKGVNGKQKNNSTNNSIQNSSDFDGYENTQIHSSSTKSPSPEAMIPPVPSIKEADIKTIDGEFGYSKFGDCELGYLQRGTEKRLVILKTLSEKREFYDEFITEMEEKWRLSNRCIDTFAMMHGYVVKHEYLAMVIEYGDVDLKKFLRSALPMQIRFTNLIEIASQVAEAMQDLHSQGFIHRDLAARNCLIYTSNLKVKICDNGAFIGEYKKEYYNEVLPVRWMSHESILQGKFTSKSDVFSFGVTLWEIMNYCKMLPHEQLSESELLAEIISENKAEMDVSANSLINMSTFYNHPFSDNSHEYATLKSPQLPQPKECPSEIYDLILECTQHSEHSRPEFHEIAYFLKKKCSNFRKI